VLDVEGGALSSLSLSLSLPSVPSERSQRPTLCRCLVSARVHTTTTNTHPYTRKPLLCLDAYGGGTSEGTPLIFWSIKLGGGSNQQFSLVEESSSVGGGGGGGGGLLLIPAHAPSLAVGAPQLVESVRMRTRAAAAVALRRASSQQQQPACLPLRTEESSDRDSEDLGVVIDDAAAAAEGEDDVSLFSGGVPLELVARSSPAALRWGWCAPQPNTTPRSGSAAVRRMPSWSTAEEAAAAAVRAVDTAINAAIRTTASTCATDRRESPQVRVGM